MNEYTKPVPLLMHKGGVTPGCSFVVFMHDVGHPKPSGQFCWSSSLVVPKFETYIYRRRAEVCCLYNNDSGTDSSMATSYETIENSGREML
jgi:hypothetical protein